MLTELQDRGVVEGTGDVVLPQARRQVVPEHSVLLKAASGILSEGLDFDQEIEEELPLN